MEIKLTGNQDSRNYWLFKSEPLEYSFDDLVSDGISEWDGVRNFQARNMLRDAIKEGDGVLFYHSNSKPLAIIGTARVVRSGYPDFTGWDSNSKHYDPKSSPVNPIWYMVDIEAERRFIQPIAREALMMIPGLSGMVLLRRGTRLSIQPVTSEEWNIILKLDQG